ncbi:WUSCHEL-related homeobox 11-like isoform X2 [Salvia miltiorrhiza]|uniref:WUSCHEL-related homeobox 11-like isoform X2 n=1 Tax=Salvia miltiorrhiza TaxID=226208 RepID=UPI0025AC8B3F|nr:WUSCHEL-related homeobox 11-like isoform X2 [Salvia miltiorrhiza]
MEDPARATGGSRQQHHGGGGGDASEQPVRSRWTPKPEQILILETIFNSGMVNPPKDETVRIRKLLEKFGSVADANVFYWFQNRRSRSRRRQRQVQATLAADQPPPSRRLPAHHYDQHGFAPPAAANFPPNSFSYAMINSASSSSSSSSSFGLEADDGGADNSGCGGFGFSPYPGLMHELEQNPIFGAAEAPTSQIQPQMMTVFFNGVATEVGRGPVDIKSMFGGDFAVFHSSGMAMEANEYGFLVHGLQHGESYFLVPKLP